MSGRPEPRSVEPDRHAVTSDQEPAAFPARRSRLVPVLITLVTAAVAAVLGRTMWRAYMDTPWTRDGTVRAYVVAKIGRASCRERV